MDKTAPIVRLQDLPVGTVIRDHDQGRYELAGFGSNEPLERVWMESDPHCVDCSELVMEVVDIMSFDPGIGSVNAKSADEIFRNWTVVLVQPDIDRDLLDRIIKFNEAKIAHPNHR